MLFRYVNSTAAIGAVSLALTIVAAPALAKDCKSQIYNGYSTGVQLDATKAAIEIWINRVRADYGANWSDWDLAEGKQIACNDVDPSIGRVGCQASARPCLGMTIKKKEDVIKKIEPKN
jgi:hypothetical protein